MKVFWSWQSDLSGKISRHLIRDALDAAITELNADLAVEEPNREGEISLDHDRKGTTGSPTLADVIFDKIRACDVFVADVTPVGATPSTPPKKLINSNVGIELGLAIGALTDRKILMVLNTAYGGREDLPFDLRHKAGPIAYFLTEDADKVAVAAAKKALTSEFKVALKGFVQSHNPTAKVFEPVPSTNGDPSRFFMPDDLLVERAGDSIGRRNVRLSVTKSPLLYLRVIPTKSQTALSFLEADELTRGNPISPFSHEWRSKGAHLNRWGAIICEEISQEQTIIHAVQLHLNRELWGFDAYLPSPTHKPENSRYSGIWATNLEEAYRNNLAEYVRYMEMRLGVAPPYDIEAGISGVANHVLYVGGRLGTVEYGPFLVDPLVIRQRLHSTDQSAIDAVLLKIFDKFFEAVGQRRPEGFHGFPKKGV